MADDSFEGWAILELMGHRRLAGYVREVELAGQGMLRLDVPEHPPGRCTCGSTDPDSLSHEDHRHDCFLFSEPESAPTDVNATQFYAATALYCLTPTTEATARALAARSRPAPAQRWELAPPPQYATVADEEPDDEEDPF